MGERVLKVNNCGCYIVTVLHSHRELSSGRMPCHSGLITIKLLYRIEPVTCRILRLNIVKANKTIRVTSGVGWMYTVDRDRREI